MTKRFKLSSPPGLERGEYDRQQAQIKLPPPPYHPLLQCHVIDLRYDFQKRLGRIDFPRYECCDMQGCITYFVGLHPDVRRIDTFAGKFQDTSYQLAEDGEWIALC